MSARVTTKLRTFNLPGAEVVVGENSAALPRLVSLNAELWDGAAGHR